MINSSGAALEASPWRGGKVKRKETRTVVQFAVTSAEALLLVGRPSLLATAKYSQRPSSALVRMNQKSSDLNMLLDCLK